MSSARYIVSDTLTALRAMPDASVDLILTSPPFLGLRSYLPADHPDKQLEMGSEATPGEFIDALLDVTEQCRRVLAPHGSLCVELGDTYAGSGGAGGDYGDGGLRKNQPKFKANTDRYRGYSGGGNHATNDGGTRVVNSGGSGWPQDKSLCLIPELYRIALVYGFNPLTGRSTPTWRARNVVRWCRPNPPVGALGDKFRPGTSDMVIACVSRTRYFDLDAVRAPYSENTHARVAATVERQQRTAKTWNRGSLADANNNGAGAPPLDWWAIPTQPYPGSHYATFPEQLCVKPILAMCPQKVCLVCGKPSERIVETSWELDESRPQKKRAMEIARNAGLTTAHFEAIRACGISDAGKAKDIQTGSGRNAPETQRLADEAKGVLGGYYREFTYGNTKATGWSDCGHDTWRPGVTLDPFAGSGTTMAVAFGHGRSSIGIDLDARNADLARNRVGMWLEVEYPATEVPV